MFVVVEAVVGHLGLEAGPQLLHGRIRTPGLNIIGPGIPYNWLKRYLKKMYKDKESDSTKTSLPP